MKKSILSFAFISLFLVSCNSTNSGKTQSEKTTDTTNVMEQKDYIQADTYDTGDGQIKITLVGHGSLMLEYKGKIIHIDPYSKVADYSRLPKADIVLLTHEHADHLDTMAINTIKKENTYFLMSQVCRDILGYGDVIKNGESNDKTGILPLIKAVPAYNIVNKKPDGEAYHPKGRGNGYVLPLDNFTIYVAGDTENIPEMDNLGKIDVAFLPKNLPYTMSDDMFIDAVKKVKATYIYPYHFSEFDQTKIGNALQDSVTELLLRPMSNL
ncbi:MAG TPA: metal-dependent hydrolase [Dysgonomonas sp.]|nr:metal-dependent hydrolase [Dysgonomonas sp.]